MEFPGIIIILIIAYHLSAFAQSHSLLLCSVPLPWVRKSESSYKEDQTRNSLTL